jgi:hypothetical protein
MRDHTQINERREHEKAELLSRFRDFFERSTWGKTRLSRELGVSITSVDRWLDGNNHIPAADFWEGSPIQFRPRTNQAIDPKNLDPLASLEETSGESRTDESANAGDEKLHG